MRRCEGPRGGAAKMAVEAPTAAEYSRVVGERGLLFRLYSGDPLYEILVMNLSRFASQSEHPRLNADCLELRPVEVISATPQLLKVDLRIDIHLARVDLGTGKG